MVELLRGHTPEHFSLLNKDAVREYRYVREGEATVQTPFGKVATIIYRSERENSPRVTRFWCAPWRGYVPLRVQQKRGDDVEWTMEIQSLTRESASECAGCGAHNATFSPRGETKEGVDDGQLPLDDLKMLQILGVEGLAACKIHGRDDDRVIHGEPVAFRNLDGAVMRLERQRTGAADSGNCRENFADFRE